MRLSAFTLLALSCYATSVRAHSGGASIAVLRAPDRVGIISDQSFELGWEDADRRFETSTVTFDFFYTRTPPPTAPPGVLPYAIEGRFIAVGVDELDPTNRLLWDTSRVPAGSYVLWSIAHEEPPDLPVTMVSLSRGVVTIAHPGDPIHPAVLVALEEESVSRDGFLIPYEAFDPAGTASVSISVSRNFDGSGAVVVGRSLPASSRGSFFWSAEGFAPGRYSVRARISDARGLAFENYGRFYLRLDPNAPPRQDAGAGDLAVQYDADPPSPDVPRGPDAAGSGAEARPEAGLPAGPDADTASPQVELGCGCRGAHPCAQGRPGLTALLGLMLLLGWRARALPRA